jgi:hypothetical protein
MTEAEQIERLTVLASYISKYEVNTVLHRTLGDVPYLMAAHTPGASQICHSAKQGGYDVWKRDGNRRMLAQTNLDVGAVANIIIMEYMREKVRRAKRNDPRLREYPDDALLSHLLKGYQRQSDGHPQ